MKYRISIIAIAILIISCSHGTTRFFPSGENLTNPAEIIIIRNKNLMCGGQSTTIMLDGLDIAHLRIAEYVSFFVEPGVHHIRAVPFLGRQGWISDNFEEGKKYYLLISLTIYGDYNVLDLIFDTSPDPGCDFEIEIISEEKGLKRIKKSKNLIKLEKGFKTANEVAHVERELKKKAYSINPQEPWTGAWALKHYYGDGDILVLTQTGKNVKSTKDSCCKFMGEFEGGYLNGWMELRSRQYLRLKMSPDNLSFSGSFKHTMSAVTGQIWGKRKE
ncbi:MAG: hypothetical protein JSU83_23850 [Deltaproteobacteria bacterium]|nr:MAG: hypothetical protein JSU83_23850 [Deltaproteobacteria bacterium]